jgi:hypothetical protein
MILSNLITEKRRLDTAAAAMRPKIITRNKPRVLTPVACLRNWSPSAAAMVEGFKWDKGKWFALQGRVTFTSFQSLQVSRRSAKCFADDAAKFRTFTG